MSMTISPWREEHDLLQLRPVSVGVMPVCHSCPEGGTLRFTARIDPYSADDLTVTWDLLSGQGSVDENGLYTAPELIVGNPPWPAVVRATSVQDPTRYGVGVAELGERRQRA